MKDSLEIHPPKGYEIDLDASDLSKNIIKFKEKSIKLPTTNNECVPFLPKKCYFIDSHGIIVSLWDNPNIYAKDLNTITSKEYAEAFSALMQLIKFRDIWNEGWIPDWKEDSYKYVIYFSCNVKMEISIDSTSAPLAFKSKEIRDKFSETFNELINKAKPLL